MIYYIKLGKIRGLSLELKKDFGLKPFFEKNTFHHETIIDIPLAQIIYTSGKWTPKKRVIRKPVVTKTAKMRSASNVNSQDDQTTKCLTGTDRN